MFFKSLFYGKIPDKFKETNVSNTNCNNKWDVENPNPDHKYILIYDEPKVLDVNNVKNNNKFSKNLYKIA